MRIKYFKRRKAKAGRIVLTLAIFIFLLGSYGVSSVRAADEPQVLKVLTYNIHHGADPLGQWNLDAIIATIRQSGADIVALQEVDRLWGLRSANLDEAEYIAGQLGMNYVFGPTLQKNAGVSQYGIMIASKYKIVNSDFRLLPGTLEQRGVLLSYIETPQGVIPFASTHLGLSPSDRKEQIEAVLAFLPQRDDLFLTGDFNVEADGGELAPFDTRLRDMQKVCGLGFVGTCLVSRKWARIDFILAGNHWESNYFRVLPDQTSDHLPVYLEITQAVPLQTRLSPGGESGRPLVSKP